MAVYRNLEGELREFPNSVTGKIYEEPVASLHRAWTYNGAPYWEVRHGVMRWYRLQAVELADLRNQADA